MVAVDVVVAEEAEGVAEEVVEVVVGDHLEQHSQSRYRGVA